MAEPQLTLTRDQIIERVEAYFESSRKVGGGLVTLNDYSAAALADRLLYQPDTRNFAASLSPSSASRPKTECQHFPLDETAVKNLADWMNDGDGGLQEVTLHVDGEGHLSVSITDYPEEGAMPLFDGARYVGARNG